MGLAQLTHGALLLVSTIPSRSHHLSSSSSLNPLNSERRDLMETPPPNLDSLDIMSGCGSLHFFPSAARRILSDDNWIRHHTRFLCVCLAVLIIAEYHQESLSDFFDQLYLILPSLWAIQCLVFCYPSSVGYRFLLGEWTLGQMRHWSATSTSSVPPLSWHIFHCPTFPHHFQMAPEFHLPLPVISPSTSCPLPIHKCPQSTHKI